MTLRDIVTRQQQVLQQQAAGGGGGLQAGGAGSSSSSNLVAAGAAAAGGGAAADGGSGSPLSKARSKGKLIGELQQLRAAMAAAESKLGALEAEKVGGWGPGRWPARVLMA